MNRRSLIQGTLLVVLALALLGMAGLMEVLAQDAVTPTPATPTPTVPMIRFKVFVAPDSAPLRAVPRADAPVVAEVRGGTALDAVGRSQPAPATPGPTPTRGPLQPGAPAGVDRDNTWLLVIYPANSEGRVWLRLADVRIYSDITLLPVMGEAQTKVIGSTAPAAVAPAPAAPAAAPALAPVAAPATGGSSGRVIAEPTLNVRAGPSTNDAVIAKLTTGAQVTIVDRSADGAWLQVVYDAATGARGWVAAQFVEVMTAAGAPAAVSAITPTVTAPLPAGGQIAQVIVPSLNVRAGPGTNYAILGRLTAGAQVKITGRNAESTWWEMIYDATSARGWIAAQFTQATADAAQAPIVTPTAQPLAPTATPSTGGAFTGKLALLTYSGGVLYLVNADGSGLTQVTFGVIDPDLSPDGSRIVYARWPGGPDPEGLYLRDLANNNEWKLWGTHLPRAPQWSPDGRYVVFSFQRGGREGYEELRLEFPDPRRPGETIVFKQLLIPDPNWRLGHIDTWDGTYRDVPAVPYASNPTWSPDGQRIMYDDDRGFEVTTLSGPSQAINQEVRFRNPNWSPAGGQVVFEYKYQSNTDIYIMNEDGSGVARLTATDPLAPRAANNVSPTWSPDGQWIAFLTDRNGQWEVYVMKPDGSQQQPLFSGGLPGVGFNPGSPGERLLSWSR